MTKAIITRGRTTIEIPGTDYVAMHPFYGPANARTLKERIRADGFIEPTSRQVAVVAHSLYGGPEPEEQEFTTRMKQNYLRAFTGILYDPQTQLAHFIDYPEFDERSMVRTDNLITRVGERYAQVPFSDLKEGVVAWNKVAKHPYFIAWAGEAGAEKLAELASKHEKKEAHFWVPNVSDLKQPEARVAALYSGWSGGRLGVIAGNQGVDGSGYSFGVRGK